MNIKFSTWLTVQITPRRKKTPPSPLTRAIRRGIGLLGLILISLFLIWRIHLYLEINRRLASIRAAGLPTSGAELNHWVGNIPDTENGALVLTQAFSLCRTFSDARSNQVVEPRFLSRTNEWSAQDVEMISEFIQTNETALAKAKDAFMLRGFRYPADYSYGPDTELPHLSWLKSLARTCSLKAALNAGQNRTNDWPVCVALALELASTLDDEPIIISHLVRNAMITTCVKTTERALNRTGVAEDAAMKLQADFSRARATNSLPKSFIGERAMGIPIFRLSWKEIHSFDQDNEADALPRKPQRYSGKPAPFLWFSGFLERDLNFFLKTMDKSVYFSKLPMPSSLGLTNYFETASVTAQKRAYLLSAMLLPSFSRVIVREASMQAGIGNAITALALERFRASRGRLPQDLSELVPEFLPSIPSDPFDGAQLRYHRLAHGYVIYSVGADGQDDGGHEPPDHRKSSDKASYDITFIVER